MLNTLDRDIAVRIEVLRQEAVEASKTGDYPKAIDALNTAWDQLPDPKVIWPESFTISQYLVSLYLKAGDIELAYIMAQQLMDCSPDRQDIGEREFHLGRTEYERGDMEAALRSFQ